MVKPKDWGPDILDLIRRVKEMVPSEGPFELGSGRSVVDPALFHKSLLEDIDAGPGGPRSRTGALKAELIEYVKARET